MSVIFKYKIEITESQEIELPPFSEILSVQVQNGIPCIWVQHDGGLEQRKATKIIIIGTGESFKPAGLVYIGTFQINGYVWHLYEKM